MRRGEGVTERLRSDAAGIARAAELLRAGGLVAMPTETVYGLAARALDPIAVAKIFAAKQRPRFDPLIVHVAERKDLQELLAPRALADPRLSLLADALWPGPLTIVAPANAHVPSIVRAGLTTVGVRIPDHPVALQLIRETGEPLAAPSANRFGRLSPTRAEHVLADLDGAIDAIVDDGSTRVGVESTVIALTPDEPAMILRPGGTPVERLRELLAPFGGVQIATAIQSGQAPLPAPGMTAAHYAPRTPVRLTAAPGGATAQEPAFGGLARCALLAIDSDDLSRLQSAAKEHGVAVIAAQSLSDARDPVAAAAALFDRLHDLDAALHASGANGAASAIVASPYPEAGLGLAIADRLRRAAAANAERGAR